MAPTAAVSASDIPEEIWGEIIYKLDDDRRCEFHLQSLSLVCKQLLSITNHHKQTLKIVNQNVDFLPSLFHRFPNLKHLSLSGCPKHKLVPILYQIAQFNFSLESLDLSINPDLPVRGLKRLPAATLSGVKSLNIRLIRSIDDADLRLIADYFPSLQDLDLSNCNNSYYLRQFKDYQGYRRKKATDDGISVLASRLKCLRRINLNDNHWVSDKGLISLSKNCPDLEEIAVKECISVTETGIGFALQACKNLRKLGSSIDVDDIIQPLSQARSLSEIDFSNACVSNESLFAMANASLPLKSFSLDDGCYGFSDAGISAFLTSYDSLDHFAIEGQYFTPDDYHHCMSSDESMITLAKSLKKARSVNLNHFYYLSESTLFDLIKQCPLLETVEMKNTRIGKEGFREYDAVSPRMKTLDLSWNDNLNNQSLKKIALACPNLETLLLDYCDGISINDVREIFRNCSRLNYISVDAACTGRRY